MMSKTHIAIGAVTALMGSVLTNPKDCGIVVIGGVVGGIIADNDILDNDYLGDALLRQLSCFKLTYHFSHFKKFIAKEHLTL